MAMEKQKSEFEQRILDVRRVARVVSGGRRFSFRVTVALGDRKGRVGIGTAKGQDVTASVEKAARQARKNMTRIVMHNRTIPHEITYKFKSAKLILRPTKPGTGVIAGGSVRVVCELAGIKDITGKIVGKSSNKINNSIATVEAFKKMKPRPKRGDQKTQDRQAKEQPVAAS